MEKYFVFIVKTKDTSLDYTLSRKVLPIVKFFSNRKAAEEWLFKVGRKYNLEQDKFSGRCLAAWKGRIENSSGWEELRAGLFKFSEEGHFIMPSEKVFYAQ